MLTLKRTRDANAAIEDAAVGKLGEAELARRLRGVTREIAQLNREMADQLVLLASQTGDTRPLIGAVQALRKVREYYAQGGDMGAEPEASMDAHEALADTLFALGRGRDDREALDHAVISYRSAITLASLIGDEAARTRLRANYRACLARLDGAAADARPLRAA